MFKFSDLNLYIYLLWFLLGIYSVSSVPIQRSVLQTLTDSSKDSKFKCPYLRSSILLKDLETILPNCPSFELAKSLDRVDVSNVNNGLCILYFNNFANLCYITNTFTTYDKLESAIPDSFLNIDTICKTLINNTQIVNITKPGIDAITQRLQNGKCNRICTDYDGKLIPICTLSAYLTHIANEINNEKAAAKTGIELESKVGSTPLPSEKILPQVVDAVPLQNLLPKTNSKHTNLDLQDSPSFNPKLSEVGQVEGGIDKTTTTPKTISADNVQKTLSEEPLDKQNPEIIKKPEIAYVSSSTPTKTSIEENIHMPVSVHNQRSKEQSLDLENIKKELLSKPVSTTNKPTVISASIVEAVEKNLKQTDVGPIDKDSEEQDIGVFGKEGMSQPDVKEEITDNDDIQIGDGNTDYGNEIPPKSSEVKVNVDDKLREKHKPLQTDKEPYADSANYQNQNIDDSDSYFFSYFMMFCIIFICGYVAYHNKQKILALVIEGRRGRRPSRSRRPNSANYHKLDSNLEEAVTSTCNKSAPQVIY